MLDAPPLPSWEPGQDHRACPRVLLLTPGTLRQLPRSESCGGDVSPERSLTSLIRGRSKHPPVIRLDPSIELRPDGEVGFGPEEGHETDEQGYDERDNPHQGEA